jgi:steroid delta-isomerase-like uncharacterized protein
MTPGHGDDSRLTRRGAVARLGAAGAGLALAGRHLAAAAQDGTPMAGTLPPVLRQWFDAWNGGDPATTLPPLYTADGVYEDVPSNTKATGTDGIHAFIAAFAKVVSDIKVEPQSGFATDTWAAAEYWFGATDRGFIPGGEGKPFRVRTVTVFELQGDKIRRSSDYYDVATILAQLGLMPGAGGSGTPTALAT